MEHEHGRFAAYFTEEICNHLPDMIRELLLRTAWLTTVRPGDAAKLSGIRNAARYLEWLAQRQMFVDRLEGGRPAYAYHPLLRDCLRAEAERVLAEDELRALKLNTAELLAAAGDSDEAARLYRDTGHWDALQRLIRGEAAGIMLAQGRHHRLHEWLDWLPEACLDDDTWLRYWQGSAALAYDPRAAVSNLVRAYAGFEAAGDSMGLYLAWLGIRDSIMFANDSLAEVPRWLAELERIRNRFGPCPDPVIAARVDFTTFNMGFTACRDSRPAEEWATEAERLRGLLPAIADDTSRCLAASHLAMYFTWHHQTAQLKLLADALQAYAAGRIAPLAHVIASLVEITRRWNTGATAGTVALIDEALDTVERHGLAVGRLWLLSAATIYHLTRQDRDRARKLLTR